MYVLSVTQFVVCRGCICTCGSSGVYGSTIATKRVQVWNRVLTATICDGFKAKGFVFDAFVSCLIESSPLLPIHNEMLMLKDRTAKAFGSCRTACKEKLVGVENDSGSQPNHRLWLTP